MDFKKTLLYSSLVFVIFLTIFLGYYFYIESGRKFMTIAFLDVGQGDAIFLETLNGNQVLIDTGPDSKVIREISKIIPFYDRKIDLLIGTHSDSDHVGGFPEILKRLKLEKIGWNGIEDDDPLNSEINNLAESKKIDQIILNAGDKIILDKENGVFVEVLWPIENQKLKDNNEYSLITRISYKNISIMLTGDASIDAERELAKAKNIDLKSNILKAGHHGSKTSTSIEFLQEITPEFVIISAGKENKFGHPHSEVIENIKNNTNAKILETFASSTIIFESDGESVWLK